MEGDRPVRGWMRVNVRYAFNESACLGLQAKAGGKFLLKLNTGERPIANKYCEGKMKRTLKKESKVPEIAERESVAMNDLPLASIQRPGWRRWLLYIELVIGGQCSG